MDEADRMVHLGFEADLTFILDALPSETMQGEDLGEQMDVDGETMIKKGRTRVTTLFSATMPPAVERLARKYLKKPAVITIGEAGRAVDTVEQRVEFVSGDEKKKQVARLRWVHSATDISTDRNWSRSLTVGSTHLQLLCLSIRRRLQTWLPRISLAQVYVAIRLGFFFWLLISQFSGAPLRCIRAKTKNNERPRCNRCAMANRMYLLLLTLQDGVSTSKMSALSSTFKWRTRLKPTCTVLVSPSWMKM